MPTKTVPTTPLDERSLADSASNLLATMTSLPAGHPSRARVRDQVIETLQIVIEGTHGMFGTHVGGSLRADDETLPSRSGQ